MERVRIISDLEKEVKKANALDALAEWARSHDC